VVLASITAFGVAITPLHAVDQYVATSLRAFLWALTGVLSWPCTPHWAFLIIQAPLVALVILTLWKRIPFDDIRWFLVVVALFFGMQALMVAYKRCGIWDASKYTDFWGVLLLVNCASLYFLLQPSRWRFVIYPFAALWFGACICGAFYQAVDILPRQIEDFHSDQLETENNARDYLSTGNPIYLQGKIPFESPDAMKATLASNTVRQILPSNLVNPYQPLSPVRKEIVGGFTQSGYPSRLPLLNKLGFGSYGGNGAASKSTITLHFKAPRGAREINLQVAGYPNAPGMTLRVDESHGKSFNLIPPVDPGNNWQTISVRLGRKSSTFKIVAKDRTDGAWLALSLPSVSTDGLPARLARSLASGFAYFIGVGIVLLILGGLGSLAGVPET